MSDLLGRCYGDAAANYPAAKSRRRCDRWSDGFAGMSVSRNQILDCVGPSEFPQLVGDHSNGVLARLQADVIARKSVTRMGNTQAARRP